MFKSPEDIRDYWENIFNTMNDGMLLIRPDGTIYKVNRALEALLGYAPNELIGKACTLLNCDACELIKNKGGTVWCTLFETGQDIKKQCLVIRKDGTYLPVLKNASILYDWAGQALGAVETLTDISQVQKLDNEIRQLSQQVQVEDGQHGIIGTSAAMRHVFEVIEKAARSDAPVIVFGESGTGKELVARAIHNLGSRRVGPFVRVNCAALNASLLESELFGHIKGAFTGAYRHRMGRFEYAHGGDIFLDEIGDVPFSVQVKLLHVLESRQFERVGDHRPISVDVRIISATNKDLTELIARQKFREDLFFRINVIPIHLPPLRERVKDIPLLAKAFVQRLRRQSGKQITGLSPATMAKLTGYHWPGNVREFKSALEYAFVIQEEGLIEPEHLPQPILKSQNEVKQKSKFLTAINQDEKAALIDALRQSMGNKSLTARILGVSRGTVWNRMRKYGIDVKDVIFS